MTLFFTFCFFVALVCFLVALVWFILILICVKELLSKTATITYDLLFASVLAALLLGFSLHFMVRGHMKLNNELKIEVCKE